MNDFKPTDVPPLNVGTTLVFDEVIGRSERVALLLRSIVVYSNMAQVNVEAFRAPKVDQEVWGPMLLSACSIPASSSAMRISWKLGDGERRALQCWGSSGGDHHFSATYWGRLDQEALPVDLLVEWPDFGSCEVALPTEKIAGFLTDGAAIW